MPGSLPNFEPAPAPLPEDDFGKILNDVLKHAVWVPGEELRKSATMLRQFADLHKEWPLAEAIRRVLRALAAQARRLAEVEAELAASKRNERRWIAKGEEAIAERNAANAALEAIKKHQEIVAGTGAAQMSTTWKIANAHLRSIGSLRASVAATEASA